ncbi:hypothetical protein CK203_052770 [Vitis vinifera]|uniref:Retrotransposon Copia-like N-terminal domain-containing protein n=1 Tax=Vitis vinifera TaxID=29760 RepID=A0A438FUU4_VITVI|nr:hypothetical protein CK203_052770 [Vitis vinifera]
MSDISNESTTVPQPSLNNLIKASAVDDPNYAIWDAENSMVMTWLVNSMEEDISSNYMCYPTAQELWENDNVTKYFNSLKRIWQDLDLFNTYEWKSAENRCHHKTTMEDNRIFKFLAGLNVEFDEVSGRIIGRQPMPSIGEVFSKVRREESQMNVMLGKKGPGVAIEGLALVTMGGGYNKATTFQSKSDERPRKGKTGDKPGRAIIPIANEAKTSPFTTEQMEHLLALLKSNSTSDTSSVSMAHTGNELYALSCRFKSTPWIIDSKASDHMTNSSNMFESYSPCLGNKKDRSSGKTIGSARMINVYPSFGVLEKGNLPSVPTPILASSSSVTDLSLPSHFDPSPEISTPEPGLGLAPVVPTQDLDLDLPIALRKGTRAYTKHLIAKYFKQL